MTARKRTLGLQPVMTLAHSAALHRACRATLLSESSSSSSSSDASFGSSSKTTSHTLESSFTASLRGTQISPEDHSHHSSEAVCSPSGQLTHRRGTLDTHSYDSSDGSPKTHAELDMDSDIHVDINTKTTVTMTVDGLGIEPDMVVVEMGFEPGLAVVESEEGTIEIGVDITTRIDIPNDLHMPDAIKRLRHLEDGVQGMYEHMLETPLQRSSLLERVAALEHSNTRLQDALGVERVRADSLQ
ncbi:hypothetical protein Tco_0494601 [Tanacetum coccineum]